MKYIFIDSNQYRHLYSKSEGFSDSVYELLKTLAESNHTVLLLPQQTIDEVERNRYRGWPEAEAKRIEKQIEKLDEKSKKVEEFYESYGSSKKLSREIQKEKQALKKASESSSKSFVNLSSKANKKTKQLFSLAKIIKENDEILEKAKTRHQKGNPPYDSGGIGDSIIWESLISFLKSQSGRTKDLIFVSNDKVAWGDGKFDAWLEKEYKRRVRGTVQYISRLSDIPDATSAEQEKVRLEEQTHLKENTVTDFINSDSWSDAGRQASKLILYKELLTEKDYEEILKASVSNSQIYNSFFTSIPLKQLVSGDNGFVVRKLESQDKAVWNEFVSKFFIKDKRRVDEESLPNISLSTSQNIEDDFDHIPF